MIMVGWKALNMMMKIDSITNHAFLNTLNGIIS